MKSIAISILAIFIIVNIASSQEVKVMASYSTSTYFKFKSNFGYGIGINKIIKEKNKFGFTFTHQFYQKHYSYTYYSDAYGITYERDANAKNQKLSFLFSYVFNIAKTEKSKTFLGPSISLNYFKINEDLHEVIKDSTSTDYNYIQWDMSKIGIGLVFEYEHFIFSDQMSIVFSMQPELVFYSQINTYGASGPGLVPFFNFGLAFQYLLPKPKGIKQ